MSQWQDGISPARRSDGQITLLDILDKVLDKGLVVAGDISISLVNVELLTVKVRLLVCSIDKAVEIGMDWWRHDTFLTSGSESENAALRARVEALERQLAALPVAPENPQTSAGATTRRRQRRGGSNVS